jgi:endoglucanase
MRFLPMIFPLLPLLAQAYTVVNGHLYDGKGNPMRIRGISWFGMETPDRAPNGLWVHDMAFYMDLLAADGFNVLRVPFSAQWVLYDMDAYPDEGFVSADPGNQHKKSVEIMDTLFDMAHARNMRILLDLHRLNWGYISELHYDPNDGRFTSDGFLETWYKILDRYADHPALWGVDLLNEPHGRATWGTNDPQTDWRMFADVAIRRIETRYPNASWIYLVEGIEWGKQLAGARFAPLDFPPHRVAYSAHNYGRSVVPSINTWDTSSLYNDWDSHFGFLREDNHTVIVGEWGGRTDIDRDWMTIFVQYLKERDMTNTFFWSGGPNSQDVAGYMLDDWTSVDEFKRSVIAELQPNPFPKTKVPRV